VVDLAAQGKEGYHSCLHNCWEKCYEDWLLHGG